MDRVNECDWCLAGARGCRLKSLPATDAKGKLIVSLFLMLPYLLDCLICARNAMYIVLLLQMMGDGMGGGGRGERGGGGGH